MSKKSLTSTKVSDEYTDLSIEVNGFEVSSEASLSPALRFGHMPFSQRDDPALDFATTLQINGVCLSPEKRKDETYRLTVVGKEMHAGEHSLKLEDFQARDEKGIPQYRSHRGEQVPIYDPPKGIGRLQKERGSKIWGLWLWVPPYLITDMLLQLTRVQPLYLSIQEHKSGRDKWVTGFSLQTSLPEVLD